MSYTLLERSLAATSRKIGAYPFISLLLLVGIFTSFSIGLRESVPLLEGVPLLTLAVIGLIAGWVLARSKLQGWLSLLLAIMLCDLIVIITAAGLWSPLIYLLREMFLILPQVLRWPWVGPPDLTVFESLAASILLSAGEVALEGIRWLLAAVPAQNPAPLILWMFITIAAALWAAWAVRRLSQPLIALLPAGAVLAAILNISRSGTIMLLPFLVAGLILIAYVSYKKRERDWEIDGLDYPESIRVDFSLSILTVIIILAIASAVAPAVSVRAIVEVARQVFAAQIDQTESFAESIGIADRLPDDSSVASSQPPGLPRVHLLGSGPDLSRNVVMIVNVEGMQGASGLVPGSPLPAKYWRGATYDVYNGHGWSTSDLNTTSYSAGQQVPYIDYPHQQVFQHRNHTTTDLGNRLYAAGTILTTDDDFQVAWRPSGDMFGALVDSSDYTTISLINMVTEAQLRSSSQLYPDWIIQRYLDLPQDTPERVIQLAHSLVEGQSTPYDRARAIESYLRTYPYTLDIPAPPAEQDVSDYFLFDLRQGYCDYYATSMVVLARAAGLPARLVVGFASGVFDGENQRFIVTEADAHSWAEIFFPGYGWIEFEPTASRTLIERPQNILDEELASQIDTLVAADTSEGEYPNWNLLTIGILFVTGVSAAAWLLADQVRLRRQAPALVVDSLYRRMHRQSSRLGVPARTSDTPYEFMAALKANINAMGKYFREESIAAINHNLSDLTDLYVQMAYSPSPVRQADRLRAISAWYQVRTWLILARFIRSTSAFIQGFGID
jgi:transglutaminase-like putative cysteine protease